jgi:hypothetical protein
MSEKKEETVVIWENTSNKPRIRDISDGNLDVVLGKPGGKLYLTEAERARCKRVPDGFVEKKYDPSLDERIKNRGK